MHNTNARLEAFSDGVFAVALTLLIIEIKVPHSENIVTKQELWHAFAHSWPSWLAFFVSFITILISWVNHTQFLKLLDKSTTKLIYANGLLLLSVTVLPFSTAAVAEYINTDIAQPAITIYCGVSLLNNLGWNALQYAALNPQSLYLPAVSQKRIIETKRYMLMGLGLYLFAFVLSFLYPLTAFILISCSYFVWLVIGISLSHKMEDE